MVLFYSYKTLCNSPVENSVLERFPAVFTADAVNLGHDRIGLRT